MPTTGWPTSAELENLITRFDTATLTKPEWTHLAHLAVGTWHVHRYGPERALERLRAGILRMNDAHGTPNTDTEGYHETITRAYVVLIDRFIAGRRSSTAAECARALLADSLSERNALLAYYSKELLMSAEARRVWKEPDRQRFAELVRHSAVRP